MINTPYKNQRKEAISAIPIPQATTQDLHSRHRSNQLTLATSTSSLYTQSLGGGGQNLCLLTPLLIILAIIVSSSCSSGEETKSSQAQITELTVTINSTDYPVTFDADRAFTVLMPSVETMPSKITVKSAVISEKANGLQASDELLVTNDQVKITITAEDGTNVSYTLFIFLPLRVTANEIPKRTSTDVRDSYVLFSIEANQNTSNYHLAVKKTSDAIPTATEMTEGALKRNLSTSSINVLIAQRLNAPMVTFAKEYFSDTTHQTLGTGMLKLFVPSENFGLIYDSSAVGVEAWIKESILKSSTGYTLYGMEEGGNQVEMLQTFVTDTALVVPTTGPILSYADSTLEENHIEIAVKANELYIFPLQVQMNAANGLSSVELYCSQQVAGNVIILPGNVGGIGTIFESVDPGYQNMLYLFKNMGSHVETYANGAVYVLVNTIHNRISYGFQYQLSDLSMEGIRHSALVKQQ